MKKKRNKVLCCEKKLLIIKLLEGKCVGCGFSDLRDLRINYINSRKGKELKGFEYNTNVYYKF